MRSFIFLFLFLAISGCASNKLNTLENKYDKHTIEKRLSILVNNTDQVENSSESIISGIINNPKLDSIVKKKACKASGSIIPENMIQHLQAIVKSLNKEKESMTKEQKNKYSTYKSKVSEMRYGKPLC